MIIIVHGGIGKTTFIKKIQEQYKNIFIHMADNVPETYLKNVKKIPNDILLETLDLNNIPKEYFRKDTFFVNISNQHQVDYIKEKIRTNINN